VPGAFARKTAERKLSVGSINSHPAFFLEITQIRCSPSNPIIPHPEEIMFLYQR